MSARSKKAIAFLKERYLPFMVRAGRAAAVAFWFAVIILNVGGFIFALVKIFGGA